MEVAIDYGSLSRSPAHRMYVLLYQRQTMARIMCRAARTRVLRFLTCVAMMWLAGTAALHAQTAITLAGTVQDPTSAVVPGATVQLLRADSTPITSALSDAAGHFQLAQPPPGDYTLVVTLSGFSSLTRPLHVGRYALPPLTLTLQLASVATNVTVDADRDLALADPAANADATRLSANDMKDLPVFDADIVATLASFLDAGIAGEGGATLIIDGVEQKTVGISPSAIQSVSVNQDPYSAMYRQPGRGQIEITTKDPDTHFHGSFSFTYRNAALNATNYFGTTKPPAQRRIYEGYLTGPLALGPAHVWQRSAFLFSLTRREQDSFQQVDATALPTSTPAQNVANPTRSTDLTMKGNHAFNDHHSAYLLYRFNNTSIKNQNVGGQTQASAGFASYQFDMDITFHDDYTFSPNKLNQFNVLFERNLDRTVSVVPGTPQIIVEGVATFGSAQADTYNTENNPNLSDIFSWTLASKHPQQIKFGVQLPNTSRLVIEDGTNRQGTYTFASIAAYQAGTPQTLSIQQGPERFQDLYEQASGFFLDQIQLTPRLTVTPGIRYEFQNTLSNTRDPVMPRLSASYVLDPRHAFVLRVGSGLYFRHVGSNIGLQHTRYQFATERNLLLTTNPPYPNVPAATLAAQLPSLFLYQPGLQSPEQAYFGLSLEREITKSSTLILGYQGYRGWHALRSIDVNAPLPPFLSTARPNPSFAQVLELNSGGYQKTDGLNLGVRGRLGNAISGFLQYTWQHADSDTEFSTFLPQNQYAPNAEWSRTMFDQRQRLSLFATLYPDKPLTLGVGFFANSPLPYTLTTGTDDFHTGLTNARPAGVPRNSVNGSGYQDVQLRLGYTRRLRPLRKEDLSALAFSVSSFNTLNRVNFQDYIGVISSPSFRQPTSANSARRLQLSASYTF